MNRWCGDKLLADDRVNRLITYLTTTSPFASSYYIATRKRRIVVYIQGARLAVVALERGGGVAINIHLERLADISELAQFNIFPDRGRRSVKVNVDQFIAVESLLVRRIGDYQERHEAEASWPFDQKKFPDYIVIDYEVPLRVSGRYCYADILALRKLPEGYQAVIVEVKHGAQAYPGSASASLGSGIVGHIADYSYFYYNHPQALDELVKQVIEPNLRFKKRLGEFPIATISANQIKEIRIEFILVNADRLRLEHYLGLGGRNSTYNLVASLKDIAPFVITFVDDDTVLSDEGAYYRRVRRLIEENK